MVKKKGQAAMEFLMTYGWAILAAIIVIAVIAIYFRPGTLVQNSVIVNAPFYAVGTTLSATEIQIELRNQIGEDLTAVTPSLDFNSPSGATCTAPAAQAISAGQAVIFTWTACSGLGTGTINADVAITYNRPGSTLNLQSTGSLSGKVA